MISVCWSLNTIVAQNTYSITSLCNSDYPAGSYMKAAELSAAVADRPHGRQSEDVCAHLTIIRSNHPYCLHGKTFITSPTVSTCHFISDMTGTTSETTYISSVLRVAELCPFPCGFSDRVSMKSDQSRYQE